MRKHILFVCRYNRFRSLIAEALFKKYNKDKSIKVKSASPIKGQPLSDNVKQLAKEFNLSIKEHPTGLTSRIMMWQDTTIIVADNVPESLFDKNKEYGKEVIVWKIRDAETNSLDELRKITKEIESKVINFVSSLKK